MFTGIVKGTGKIVDIIPNGSTHALKINVPAEIVDKLKIGDSLSVDGACLTVVSIAENVVGFDAVNETLERTIIQRYKLGNEVNLENSLSYGEHVGGHLVSGHIQTIAEIKEVEIDGRAKNLLVEIDEKYSKYIFEKGYVALNGCSLTIGRVIKNNFYLHLIPETLESTNLNNLLYGDLVNIELDQNTVTIVDTTERVLRDQTQ